MEVREKLSRQYTEATRRLMKATEQLDSFLPALEGDEVPSFVLTPDFPAKYKKAEQELKNAIAYQREILEKIWKLNQPD